MKEAETRLTQEERQRILERKHVEETAQAEEHTLTSQEEGPSKGKGADPRNWGGANLEDADLDIDAQREALSNWEHTRDWSKTVPRVAPDPNDKPPNEGAPGTGDPIQAAVEAAEDRMTRKYESQIQLLRDELRKRDIPYDKADKTSKKKRVLSKRVTIQEEETPVTHMVRKAANKLPRRPASRETPPTMDAAAQIAPKSYLGRAFTHITPKRKSHKKRGKKRSEDSPD